jgi:hypothetical protein
MPIFDRDESTRKYPDPEIGLRFIVRCDCNAEGQGCAQLEHSLVCWSEEGIPDELYVTLVPKARPWHFWGRIKQAWHILIRGELRFRDDMCLFPETLDGWANRLQEAARKIRGSKGYAWVPVGVPDGRFELRTTSSQVDPKIDAALGLRLMEILMPLGLPFVSFGNEVRVCRMGDGPLLVQRFEEDAWAQVASYDPMLEDLRKAFEHLAEKGDEDGAVGPES